MKNINNVVLGILIILGSTLIILGILLNEDIEITIGTLALLAGYLNCMSITIDKIDNQLLIIKNNVEMLQHYQKIHGKYLEKIIEQSEDDGK